MSEFLDGWRDALAGEKALRHRDVVAYLGENPAICDKLGIESLPSYQTLPGGPASWGKERKRGVNLESIYRQENQAYINCDDAD